MKITKQNILQAIKEVKKEEKIKPHHHCDVCFINYLLKIATFDKGEYIGCMKVLNGVNKAFGTAYDVHDPFCEYSDAVPYEQISRRLNRVIPI